jgi:flagellar protein FlaF
MGFSVSGASAIILLAGVLTFSMAFTAISNGHERVSDAREDRMDRYLAQENSDINITSVGTNTVRVNNTGSVVLDVDQVALVTNGTYEEPSSTAVAGTPGTTVWAPGEQLTITLSSSNPTRVKIVAETGVSDTMAGVN